MRAFWLKAAVTPHRRGASGTDRRRHYVEGMPLDPSQSYYWILVISAGLLGLIINLLLIYMVIRLAITHGMLSYSRQLADERRLPVHRD